MLLFVHTATGTKARLEKTPKVIHEKYLIAMNEDEEDEQRWSEHPRNSTRSINRSYKDEFSPIWFLTLIQDCFP